MWERHIYECLLICGFRRWELGVRLLTVLVPIAVGFIIEISRFNQLMRYIQICEKFPRQIISTIRVIICNIRKLDSICISYLIKTFNGIDLVMVLVHEIFFITSFILKDMHFDIFKFVHEKMKYDFDPKVLHFLPFLWNKYQYETKKERTSPFVIIILFSRFDMYFLSY